MFPSCAYSTSQVEAQALTMLVREGLQPLLRVMRYRGDEGEVRQTVCRWGQNWSGRGLAIWGCRDMWSMMNPGVMFGRCCMGRQLLVFESWPRTLSRRSPNGNRMGRRSLQGPGVQLPLIAVCPSVSHPMSSWTFLPPRGSFRLPRAEEWPCTCLPCENPMPLPEQFSPLFCLAA